MINRYIITVCTFCLSLTYVQAQDITSVENDSITSVNKVTSNPWQQSSGEFLISPYVSRYVATSFRNSDGQKSNFANDGKYSNYNPRLFVAAPLLSDKLNLTLSLPYFTNRYEDNNVSNSNGDLGDIEVGLRAHLGRLGSNYLMGSLITYIPGYENTQLPFAGYDLFGLEARMILAGSIDFLGEYNNFHKVEFGVRYFFPRDPVQLRFLLSEGYRITNKLIILGELEGIFSFSDNQEFFQTNLQSVAEYRFIKGSLNVGYDFSSKFSLYSGLFHDIYNRNSAIGRGFQVFAIIRTN